MVAAFTYVSIALAFATSFFVIPIWITAASQRGFVGKDVNKKEGNDVAEAGGLSVVLGTLVGFSAYIGFQVFYYDADPAGVIFSFGAVTVLLLSTMIGFIDDILGWKEGIGRVYKVLLTFTMPLPLMVLNAGSGSFNLPLIGVVDFGLLFPLVAVPAAIVGASNAFNMLAGYNGLEAGLGVIILSSLGLISYWQGALYVAALCVCAVVSLLAFLFYNWYPASIFPGDTLTYSIGALIGVVSVLADIEKLALILFVPYFIELLLKVRGRFKKQSYAEPVGSALNNKYDGWYSLPHIAISFLKKLKGEAYEWEVVLSVYVFELVFVAVTFLSYFRVLPI